MKILSGRSRTPRRPGGASLSQVIRVAIGLVVGAAALATPLLAAGNERLRFLQPAVSPDGKYIAVVGVRGECRGGCLFVMHIDGAQRRRIGFLTGVQRPTWSPDGKRIAVAAGEPGIWIVRVADGAAREVAANGDWPAWAPVGRRIAFSQAPDETSGASIRVAEDDGSHNRLLATPRSVYASYTAPAWSPDGRQVVFVEARAPDTPDLGPFLVRRSASKTRNVYLLRRRNPSSPAWSSDGRRIAFTEWQEPFSGSTWVSLLDLRSGKVTRLQRGQEPSWTPSAREIVFVRDGAVYRMKSNGSKAVRLTH